ncbi:MAG: FkbM family methyltransferase [Puniceicoccales bacterium]|jgi:FkbM family methyltransferase|nr:FkbM family methyltransferase [Puniceicoccales bacterium]
MEKLCLTAPQRTHLGANIAPFSPPPELGLPIATERISARRRKISPPRTTPLQLDKVKKAKVAKPAGTLPEKDIFPVGSLLFWLPDYKTDWNQKVLVSTKQLHEIDILNHVLRLLPEHSVVLDVGANIGNHSLFFRSQKKVDRVIAFEALPQLRKIIQTNIELNGLQRKINLKSFALSDKNEQLSIAAFNPKHAGSTTLKKDRNGTIGARKLDSLADELGIDRIDFVKIDVEGFESFVLAGARETFEKFKPPYVQVEIHEVHPIEALRDQFPPAMPSGTHSRTWAMS